MIKIVFYRYWLHAIFMALLALILYGVLPGAQLTILLVVFAAWRLTELAIEICRKPVSEEQWEERINKSACHNEKLPPEWLARKAILFKLKPGASAREVAQAKVATARRRELPVRPRGELGAEVLGVLAFAILLPLDAALYTRDFFSLRMAQGWEGALVVALCLILYTWPYLWLKAAEYSEIRIGWWILPFLIALPLTDHLVETRHPYLNPFAAEHNRLAAERVLALKDNVLAAQHADWVFRYARQLAAAGDTPQATSFYQQGLRLNCFDRRAAARLAELEATVPADAVVAQAATGPAPADPYWTTNQPVIPSPRRPIGPDLDQVKECSVMVVPVGNVSDELLDAVGFVLHQELDLPVYISPESVPLPPYTRKRGLATGIQWDGTAIFSAFTNTIQNFPHAPLKYLLITPVDIYMNDANFVYSATYGWGAVVSSARFKGPRNDGELLKYRTAKQALCAVIKSFNVPPSIDRNCVTCYVRNLLEFDAKGNRPSAETLRLFRTNLAAVNTGWEQFQARRRQASSP